MMRFLFIGYKETSLLCCNVFMCEQCVINKKKYVRPGKLYFNFFYDLKFVIGIDNSQINMSFSIGWFMTKELIFRCLLKKTEKKFPHSGIYGLIIPNWSPGKSFTKYCFPLLFFKYMCMKDMTAIDSSMRSSGLLWEWRTFINFL